MMNAEIQTAWKQLQDALSISQNGSMLQMLVYLMLGGVLALYIRFLYQRCSSSPSDTDSFTRVFPLLTIVTAGVIAVVKTSLALSLGLVGALSIVRFRAAIKEPEELVYLFLCIAVGLSLGAEQPLLALVLVAVASVFSFGMHRFGDRGRQPRMMLTVTGDSTKYFQEGETGLLATVERVAGRCSIHRLDIENGRAQIRVALPKTSSQEIGRVMTDLKEKLPECEFSYVNMNTTT